MLNDLDETIRHILIQAGGADFDPAQVDISFDIPNRQWSTGIQRPTINCYLFDIHERRSLREEGWQIEGRGRSDAKRRKPLLFYDISYLITAWTRAIENEHYLLWRVLETLSRFPVLNDPNAYLNNQPIANPFITPVVIKTGQPQLITLLQGQIAHYAAPDTPPIYTSIAQLEGVLKSPGEFWTALENHLKPSLSYVVTLAMDRDRPTMEAGPPVTSSGISIRLPDGPADGGFQIERLITLPNGVSPQGVSVTVEPTNVRTATDANGRFKLAGLSAGAHTLRIEAGGQVFRCVVTLHGFRVNRVFPLPPGTPLKGIDVTVKDKTNAQVHRATTDDQGMFRLENLQPGNYLLITQVAGQEYKQYVLLRGPNERAVDPFRDVVRDQAGNPIPGVDVEVEELGLRTQTSPAGEFSFDLPPGSYTLVIHFAGWAERRRIAVRPPVYRQSLHYGGASAP